MYVYDSINVDLYGMEEVIGSIPTTFVDNRCTRGLFPFQCFHYLAAELPEQPGLTDRRVFGIRMVSIVPRLYRGRGVRVLAKYVPTD